ncbi:hypothetical protein [Streptomyces sp. NEAU-NA10]|uniref:hypothetical protein n=1 Tax=Streptomyces sp. NEAU-NA10 TaxID=3416050 RepID=UPI003CC51AAF
MNAEERTLRARLAAHTQWAKEPDPTSRTAKARKAADERFLAEARRLHPNASDEVVARAAAQLRRAHFSRMALASAKAKRAKAAATKVPAA